MARGFVGNASASYFSGVQEVSQKSAGALSSTGGKSTGSEIPTDDGPSYPTGVGTSANIAVDDELYAEILRKIDQNDEDCAEIIYEVIQKIRTLCETDFIIPDTMPRVNATLDAVEQTLGSFREITSQTTGIVRRFVSEVGASDRGK